MQSSSDTFIPPPASKRPANHRFMSRHAWNVLRPDFNLLLNHHHQAKETRTYLYQIAQMFGSHFMNILEEKELPNSFVTHEMVFHELMDGKAYTWNTTVERLLNKASKERVPIPLTADDEEEESRFPGTAADRLVLLSAHAFYHASRLYRLTEVNFINLRNRLIQKSFAFECIDLYLFLRVFDLDTPKELVQNFLALFALKASK